MSGFEFDLVPRDKTYPPDAVQCDDCGGTGSEGACQTCGGKGWLLRGHFRARRCLNCGEPLAPTNLAVYCSTKCVVPHAS